MSTEHGSTGQASTGQASTGQASTVQGARPARRRPLPTTALVVIVLVAVIVVGVVLTALQGRSLLSPANLLAILTAMTLLGTVAIGQTLVIIVGSLDLSVPVVISTASVLAAGIMAAGEGAIVPGVLVALLAAAVIGLANGLIVTGLKVHGFVATLGTGLIVSGWLATTYQGSTGGAPRAFGILGTEVVGVALMLAIAALVSLMLHRTRLGHHMYAVGGSQQVARLSGVHTALPVIAAHVLCSVLAGVAGLISLARSLVGSPTIGAQGGYDLMSIAAVVLGGTVLAGGAGGVLGTIAGVTIFAVLDTTMSALSVDPFLKDVIRGAIIVGAVAVYAWRNVQRRPARFDGRRA